MQKQDEEFVLSDDDWKQVQKVATAQILRGTWYAEEVVRPDRDLYDVPGDFTASDGTPYSVQVLVKVARQPFPPREAVRSSMLTSDDWTEVEVAASMKIFDRTWQEEPDDTPSTAYTESPDFVASDRQGRFVQIVVKAFRHPTGPMPTIM